jgi:hypothetical protein
MIFLTRAEVRSTIAIYTAMTATSIESIEELMIYHWELVTGQQISVENRGVQTVVTVVASSAGTQQRSSSSMATGTWSAPPTMTLSPTEGILKITTATGDSYVQIRANSIHTYSSHSVTSSSTTSTSHSSSSSCSFTSDRDR